MFTVIGMLCLMMGLATVTGCKSKDAFNLNTSRIDETRTVVEKTIIEPERRVAVLELLATFEGEMKSIETKAVGLRAQIVEANRSYETTREELEKIYEQLGEQLALLGETTKQYSLELRKHCSEDEWKKITSNWSDGINFKF